VWLAVSQEGLSSMKLVSSMDNVTEPFMEN
jgi:hypothetical protein